MSELLHFRLKRNLTQEELANKAGISVRTIQRIENGVQPKGYTLRVLSSALEVSEPELLGQPTEKPDTDPQLVKWINLSVLPFVIAPPLNIIVPLILSSRMNQSNPLPKQIASIQLAWTIGAAVIFMLSVFIRKWFALPNTIILLTMTLLVLANLYIILRNAIELDRQGKLRFRLTFKLL